MGIQEFIGIDKKNETVSEAAKSFGSSKKSASSFKPAKPAAATVHIEKKPKTRKELRNAHERELEMKRELTRKRIERQRAEQSRENDGEVSADNKKPCDVVSEDVEADKTNDKEGNKKKLVEKIGVVLRKEFGEGRFLRRLSDSSKPIKTVEASAATIIANTETWGDKKAEYALHSYGKRVQERIDKYKTWKSTFYSMIFVTLICAVSSFLIKYGIVNLSEIYAQPLLIASIVIGIAAIIVAIAVIFPLRKATSAFSLDKGLSKKELKHVIEQQKQSDLLYVKRQIRFLWLTTKLPGKAGQDARRLQKAVNAVMERRNDQPKTEISA